MVIFVVEFVFLFLFLVLLALAYCVLYCEQLEDLADVDNIVEVEPTPVLKLTQKELLHLRLQRKSLY